MTERISQSDVAHVARLANLALREDELVTMTGQLAAVLDHAEDVAALDLEQIAPTTHPIQLTNVWREDIVGDTLDRAEVLSAAPVVDQDRFEVPSILGVDA